MQVTVLFNFLIVLVLRTLVEIRSTAPYRLLYFYIITSTLVFNDG